MKQLIFEVVDEYPTKPFQAYWNECSWEIMDCNELVWTIAGSKSDSVETPPTQQSTGGISGSDIAKIVAAALHPEAASKMVEK